MIRGWIEKIRLIIAISPQKLALLFFIVVSTLSLLWQIAAYFLEPSSAVPQTCLQEKAAIIQELTQAGHCDNDSDCTPFKAHCPFNCIAINKTKTTTSLVERIQAYSKQCGFCVSDCSASSRPPVCVNHQCTL